MPVYVFRHPEYPIVIEEVQKMTDPHVYTDPEGTEWERVWTAPTTSMGLNSDADSSQQFVDKTKGWSTGDMWDYSKDLSEKRKGKRGHDHIGDAHEKKRQDSINAKKPSNKKKK